LSSFNENQPNADSYNFHFFLKSNFLELPTEEPPVPAACISDSHAITHYLTEDGRISVARILTCFAYNSPDIR
jgi:hypothetical protein